MRGRAGRERGAAAGGVVAAGHPVTAEAGREILRAGGNAADAAVAACCTAVAAEAALTGLGAGGFALVRPPGGRAELIDFFVASPGQGRPEKEYAARRDLTPYEVPFRAHTQVFNIGPSSCAVPGLPSGLYALHDRHGRLPLRETVAPAVRAADRGVPLVKQQEYLHDILEGILTRYEPVREAFAPRGEFLRCGERLHIRGLAETLAIFGAEGAGPFTTGRLARLQADLIEDMGGLLTAQDLADYRPIVRRPAQARYKGHILLTNPAPSSGGTLIAHTLSLLDQARGKTTDSGEADRALTLLQTLEETDARRREILGKERSGTDQSRGTPPGPVGPVPGNTTHISVVDADGMAVSVTSSCGSGSGIMVPGTGIMLSNMMGEEDLNSEGFFTLPPGERLTSMMAPSIASNQESKEGPREIISLGSAGSERLRSAIIQVLMNILDRGMDPQTAVEAPRLHLERGVTHLEPGHPREVAARLEKEGYPVNLWPSPDLYFGGAQVAQGRFEDGRAEFQGGGDPRRGGASRRL